MQNFLTQICIKFVIKYAPELTISSDEVYSLRSGNLELLKQNRQLRGVTMNNQKNIRKQFKLSGTMKRNRRKCSRRMFS